jgi:hypothetical protein
MQHPKANKARPERAPRKRKIESQVKQASEKVSLRISTLRLMNHGLILTSLPTLRDRGCQLRRPTLLEKEIRFQTQIVKIILRLIPAINLIQCKVDRIMMVNAIQKHLL